YSTNGKVFAEYRPFSGATHSAAPTLRNDGSWFEGDRLRLYKRIWLGEQSIGTIYLESNLGEVRARFRQSATIILFIVLGASLLAYALASRLLRTVLEPIRRLAETAKLVSIRKDYAARAIKVADDDLG